MTLIRNRAGRVHARRMGALERLEAALKSGVRYVGLAAQKLHDDHSRAKAIREADTLALRVAKPPIVTFTRKKQATASEARKAYRRGKLG